MECARRVDVKKRFADGMTRYKSLRARRHVSDTVSDTEQILALQNGEHLQETTRVTTATGTSKDKLVETYHGLAVFGQSVVIEERDGDPTGQISGHLVEGIDEDVADITPSLSEDNALAVAADHWGDTLIQVIEGSVETELKIYVDDQDNSPDTLAVLAYFLSYMKRDVGGELSQPTFIIDANNGDVILAYNGLRSTNRGSMRFDRYDLSIVGGNEKMGKNLYGDTLPALNIYMEDGVCYLMNEKVTVIEARDYNSSFSFPCNESFNDSVNGAYSPNADAFFYGSLTYDLFMEWVGTEPLTYKLVIFTHVGPGLIAGWHNAAAHFGDGDEDFHPLVALDIVAHEVGHGFTQCNSDLLYFGQSGGMNEAFSDMAGAAAEGYLKLSDWLNGHDVTKNMIAVRYFEDPTMDGYSRGSMKEYCPGINVHFSSGVYNRVFFILSTSPGWNIRMAFHVFATANQLYWTENTAFNDGACAVIQAAEDLGFAAEGVRNAFVEVGINPCGPAKEGVHALHDIRALANETLQFVFELEDDNISLLRFEIFSSKPSVTTQSYTMRVDTPVRSLFSDESFEGLHVINPESGQYVVTLEFSKPVFALDLYAISGTEVLVDEFDFYSNGVFDVANGTFLLPEYLVEAGQPLLIRAINGNQMPPRFISSYEGEADILTATGELLSDRRHGYKMIYEETYICNPKPEGYNYMIERPDIVDGLRLVAETVLLPLVN